MSIIGPNGAGKSTLIKAIFGLLPVMRGRVLLRGEEITGLRPDRIVRRGMGYVPQVDNVFPSLTIHENLEMGSWVQPREFDERAHHVYGLFPDLVERRAGVPEETKERLRRAFKVLFHEQLSMRHALEQAAQEAEGCAEVRQLLEFIRQSKRGVCRA